MFVFKGIKEPAANGIDLIVEFSTLGEYGFLPDPERSEAEHPATRPCETRRRTSPVRDSLDEVPRTQLIGSLRTPRIVPNWAA